ncbi:hypothetical protein [Mesorhizobium sp. CAU 1741]|uniref:hypothetical protein n=1 Tax=Mesorhizobium sp. CAU 1741 TaxID=3140366 RepID=UPI00325B14FD
MRIRSLSVLATSALLVLAAQAHADVFSSQGFSGETTTLQALPGVNLDAGTTFSAGSALGGNCVETLAPSFSGRSMGLSEKVTECRVGNFSFSASQGQDKLPAYDNTYGGNPPPWERGWKP